MAAYNNQANAVDRVKNILNWLYNLVAVEESYYTKPQNELINIFTAASADERDRILDSLNFEDEKEASILNFLQEILAGLSAQDRSKMLTKLAQKPNTERLLFYAGLNYDFGDLSSNGNSTDSFDAGSNVHFFK